MNARSSVTSAVSALAGRGGILMIMNSLSQGGGDRVAVHLANGFAKAGIPTRIVLMRGLATSQLRLRIDPSVEVVSAGPPMGLRLSGSGDPLGHRHLERCRGLRLVRREIDRMKPAVVLGGSDNMAFVTALARRRKDHGIVFGFKLTNRLSRPTIGPLRRIYRYNLFRFIFDRLDIVLTLAEGEREHVLSVHRRREKLLRTVPNPYVTDEMLKPGPPRAPGAMRILAAGRMVAQKRFDNLLRAFALVSCDARLTILGEGPLRPELTRLAHSLGISGRVDMPGYAGDIIPWLHRSDLFVLSSDYEGLPAVILEAFACNVPVVTTESFFAAQDLVGKAAGCAVVPISDERALAAAIERCLSTANHPADLQQFAAPYRIEPALDAHIAALGDAVEQLHSRRKVG